MNEKLVLGKTDYTNSILNLTNSILKHYQAETYHETLPLLDSYLEKNYRNVVLMVFDGMGSENLTNILSKDSFLRQRMRDSIYSVFPPTTTAATTTLLSGKAPAEHGWLGWSLHFEELGETVNLYHNTTCYGTRVADYHVAEKIMPYVSVSEQIRRQGTAQAYEVSPYSQDPVNNFEEFLGRCQQLCEQDGNHYVYAYWPEPDSTMHQRGIEHDASIDWIAKINLAVKELSRKLKDTLIIVTADHGHINGVNELLTDYPALVDTLKWMPSIEPRALAFHVREGQEPVFEKEFAEHFGDSFQLLTREQVVSAGLFGSGEIHSRFEDFIGDYLAVATSDVCIYNTEEEYCEFIGAHAGLTKQEMMVPLILIECV